MSPEILRYTAFAASDQGGNPAGVVLDAHGLSQSEMMTVAAQVGFSETAFLFPTVRTGNEAGGTSHAAVRYYSPRAEVPFCGHATIAAAVAYAERYGAGRIDLATQEGLVPVRTRQQGTQLLATLTSVTPSVQPIRADLLDRTLAALGWSQHSLDASLAPAVAFAGNYHPVLAVRSRQVLAGLDYDYDSLARIMSQQEWTTMQLMWREHADLFHSRNPFPPGGVVEDPATGAAAAALGGYLRSLGLVPPSRRVTIHQGDDMGRPSLLLVDIPAEGGVEVTGSATRL